MMSHSPRKYLGHLGLFPAVCILQICLQMTGYPTVFGALISKDPKTVGGTGAPLGSSFCFKSSSGPSRQVLLDMFHQFLEYKSWSIFQDLKFVGAQVQSFLAQWYRQRDLRGSLVMFRCGFLVLSIFGRQGNKAGRSRFFVILRMEICLANELI